MILQEVLNEEQGAKAKAKNDRLLTSNRENKMQ
jgi:hypothetical protein